MIEEFRKEFEKLIVNAGIERLVVLVDDLDRCLPSTVIETLEAIRLFLFVERVSFVIGADESMIEYSVTQHFPKLTESSVPDTYTRNYLEKLIQVPFRLPSLGYLETRVYIILALTNSSKFLDQNKMEKIIDIGREVLRTPWAETEFTQTKIHSAIGDLPKELIKIIDLADRITPLLAEGTRGNPRQIKRFLNTLNLRLLIAETRGIKDKLDPQILAKIMLAERFQPHFFESIATDASATKFCKIIRELETYLDNIDTSSSTQKKGGKSKKVEPNESIKTYLENDWVKAGLLLNLNLVIRILDHICL